MVEQSRLSMTRDEKTRIEQLLFRMITIRCYPGLSRKTLGSTRRNENLMTCLTLYRGSIDKPLVRATNVPYVTGCSIRLLEPLPPRNQPPYPSNSHAATQSAKTASKHGCLKPAAVQCVAAPSLAGIPGRRQRHRQADTIANSAPQGATLWLIVARNDHQTKLLAKCGNGPATHRAKNSAVSGKPYRTKVEHDMLLIKGGQAILAGV